MNAFRSIFARNKRASWSLGVVLTLTLAVAASTAFADERTEYFIRLLQTSSSFKVRAQAALGLGRLEASTDVVGALTRALNGDDHPVVRAAAATALGKLADRAAKPALEKAKRDSSPDVRTAAKAALASLDRSANARPGASQKRDRASERRAREAPSGRARFYVGVGNPAAQARIADSTRRALREILVAQLSRVDGVVIAPPDERPKQARAVIQKRKLTGYFIDGSVVSVQRTESGVRAEVSVILGSYPDRDMKAMLRGGATVPGAGGPAAERRAIEGAFQGAVRRLQQAMESTLASGR